MLPVEVNNASVRLLPRVVSVSSSISANSRRCALERYVSIRARSVTIDVSEFTDRNFTAVDIMTVQVVDGTIRVPASVVVAILNEKPVTI